MAVHERGGERRDRARRDSGLRRRAALAAGALAATGLLSALVPAPDAHAAQAQAPAPARAAAKSPATATAAKSTPGALPAPTGPHAVGTVTRHLADSARKDPWKPERGDRQIAISLFYPADRDRPAGGKGRAPAPHMDPSSAAHFGSARGAGSFNHHVRPDAADWASTRTHARVDAPVARGSKALPVVLYSAGLGDPRTWNTGLAEELASRGYVVVTVDHTYDSSEVRLANGELAESALPALAGAPVTEVDAALRRAVRARVDDTRFVLDALGSAQWRRGLPHGLGDALDLRRVGMAGHSAGGFAAAQALHDDRRLKAGVNMDGQMDFPLPDGTGSKLSTVAREGVDRPFLLLGSDGPGAAGNRASWASFRQHNRAWQAELTMAGAAHGTYTDAVSLLPALARQGALPEEDLRQGVGTVRPERAVAATRAYVVAFFDRFLKGRDGRLLDGPSPRFPEMRFQGSPAS
ncbi:alpha/beta hydrolase family protein [Streptomyces telluris]|uniref:Esterase n=1 Tax=Streptomyces telluris TaxID=2720021 RepID=A0A9X2LKA7_9ACTN|nr:esterase [Streptomyces telluris]MCQ8772793.1 esterase [Streptomyces telluris]NJP76219.1 esterase [Streptomyces telluris]